MTSWLNEDQDYKLVNLSRHEFLPAVSVVYNYLSRLESESQGVLVALHLVEEVLCSVRVEELERTAALRTVSNTKYQSDIAVNLGVRDD